MREVVDTERFAVIGGRSGAEEAEILRWRVLVLPQRGVQGEVLVILARADHLAQVVDAMSVDVDRSKQRIDAGQRRQAERLPLRIPEHSPVESALANDLAA